MARFAQSGYVKALKSVSAGTFWVAMGAGTGQAATLIANVLVANVLGKESFGAYAFLQSTQNAFALVAQLSMGLAAARYLPQWRTERPEQAGQFVGFGTVFCLLTGLAIGVGFGLFAFIFKLPLGLPPDETLRALLITAACVPLLALTLFQNGVLMGLESFRAFALVSLATAICAVALPALGARISAAEGAIIGLAIVALIRAISGNRVVAGAAAAAGIRPQFSRSREMLHPILNFALPGTLTAVGATFAQWTLGTLILHQAGATQFALYAVTYSIRQIVLFVPVQLASVSLSLLSRRSSTDGETVQSKIFGASLIVTLFAAGSIALVVGIAAEPVLSLFGKDFTAATTLLRIMLVSAFLEAAATSIYQILPARGLMWKSLKWVGLPRDLSLLLVACIAVPKWGTYGGAAALLLCQFIAIGGIWLAVRGGTAGPRISS